MDDLRKNTIITMNRYGRERRPFVFIIDFLAKMPILVHPENMDKAGIKTEMPGFPFSRSESTVPPFHFIKHPVEYSHYQKAFNRVMAAIHRGDTFLLNLTFPTRIETNLSLDQIFLHSRAKYKLLFKGQFVVFSPEPFVTIQNHTIATFPMKGTRDATEVNAEQLLRDDGKEISEHYTIVDLLRNDLSMVAKKVRVERFRYFEKIKTHEKELLQTSSKITGELPPDWQNILGEIIFRLLPAGSVSGAPKKKTVELILEAEAYDRGYFTGIFGYFDGTNLDSAVIIRFIEKIGDQLLFKSGGGITSFSKCEEEYRELVDKVYLPIF
jgi:para-aminobenzoate synthetase component I